MSMRLYKLVIMDISLTCLRSRRSSYGCHLPSLRLKVLISSSSGVLSTGGNGIVHAMYLNDGAYRGQPKDTFAGS